MDAVSFPSASSGRRSRTGRLSGSEPRHTGYTVYAACSCPADALARHVSADAATSCLSRHTLREARTLRRLVEDARFGAVAMRVLEVMRRMPASAASVVEAMARASYAREIAAVEEAVRQAVGAEVSAALDAYRDGNAVVIPHRSHLVHAQVA